MGEELTRRNCIVGSCASAVALRWSGLASADEITGEVRLTSNLSAFIEHHPKNGSHPWISVFHDYDDGADIWFAFPTRDKARAHIEFWRRNYATR